MYSVNKNGLSMEKKKDITSIYPCLTLADQIYKEIELHSPMIILYEMSC